MHTKMTSTKAALRIVSTLTFMALFALPALAQESAAPDTSALGMTAVATTTEGTTAAATTPRSSVPMIGMSYFRSHDKRGVNVFEAPKLEGTPYTGVKIEWGAAFTQQYQSLNHENTADPRMVGTPAVDANQLIGVGSGFNTAVANLYLDAQLARGLRVEMTSYMSSRHHNEMWVKDGYLLVDGSPIENETLDKLMEVLTLRVGHFEINYGDAHFRRTDNGNALYNPFVGNLIMDAFTTEIGAEAYLRKNGFLLMGGMTGGEVRGQVTRPKDRAPSYLAKVGFDRQITPALRTRLTGSLYTTSKSVNNTLYSGSRAGSRYYDVLENTASTEAAQAWSGDVQPGMRSKISAWVVNPFVKLGGLELFGNIEQAKGRAATETEDRKFTQNSGDAVVRMLGDAVYVGGRYGTVKGRFAGMAQDVTVDRLQVGGGWFLSSNVLMKAEWVQQKFKDFPVTDIRNGGRFDGVMVEGVVAF
jgi:hypothetical protein